MLSQSQGRTYINGLFIHQWSGADAASVLTGLDSKKALTVSQQRHVCNQTEQGDVFHMASENSDDYE